MANWNEYNPNFYGAEYSRGLPLDTTYTSMYDRMNNTEVNNYYQNRGMVSPDMLSTTHTTMGNYGNEYMEDSSGIMLPWDSMSDEAVRDMEYFQSMYPASMKRMGVYVEEACDKMEYEGSPMYDEYPDRVALQRICQGICQKIMDEERQMPGPELDNEIEEVEVYEATKYYSREPHPSWSPRDPYPPTRDYDGLSDITSLLLYNEMYRRRRCRTCSRRFY